MTDSPKNKVPRFLRSAWSKWLTFFLLLGMLISPFAWNYWAIKQVEVQGGTVITEPGMLSGFISEEQREWIDENWGRSFLYPFDRATEVKFHWYASLTQHERNNELLRVDIKTLARLPKLKAINLGDCHFDEDDLIHLPQLNEFSCSESSFSNNGLKKLKGQKKLTYLNLSHTEITDKGLVHLQKHKELKTLYLGNPPPPLIDGCNLSVNRSEDDASVPKTQITDEVIKHLAGLTQLEVLSLDRTGISDEGLKHLSQLKKLKKLWLSGTNITDEGIKHLKKLKNLECLYLSETKITDQGLSQLQSLKKLTYLDLGNTKITNAGLVYLKSFPELGKVVLEDTEIVFKKEMLPLLLEICDATKLGSQDFVLQLMDYGDPKSWEQIPKILDLLQKK